MEKHRGFTELSWRCLFGLGFENFIRLDTDMDGF